MIVKYIRGPLVVVRLCIVKVWRKRICGVLMIHSFVRIINFNVRIVVYPRRVSEYMVCAFSDECVVGIVL